MTRRALLALVPGLGAFVPVMGSPHHVTLAEGTVSASDHELKDGYFAIGQATTIMVRPESTGWLHLRDLRGQRVELVARVGA